MHVEGIRNFRVVFVNLITSGLTVTASISGVKLRRSKLLLHPCLKIFIHPGISKVFDVTLEPVMTVFMAYINFHRDDISCHRMMRFSFVQACSCFTCARLEQRTMCECFIASRCCNFLIFLATLPMLHNGRGLYHMTFRSFLLNGRQRLTSYYDEDN